MEAEQADGLQHVDELVAEAVFERDPADVEPARHEDHFLVLDVHTAERTDALWEHERLWLAEGFGGEPPAVTLVHDRRVEALLDGGPDAERGGERHAIDHEVGAVAHSHFVDTREQVIGGIAGDDITEPGLDAHANDRELATFGPFVRHGELGVAEHHTGALVGMCGMRSRHVHGHVEVMAPCGVGGVEDGWVEARVARVHHHVGSGCGDELDEICGAARIDLSRPHTLAAGVPCGGRSSGGIDVGHHDLVEDRPPRRNGGDRRSDAACTHHQYPHVATVAPCTRGPGVTLRT